MQDLRPNFQRSKNAILLIWLMIIIKSISFISDYFQYDLLKSVADGDSISIATATLNDLRQRLIAILELAIYITSAITFIMWFRRAYFNLHLMTNNLEHTEGWAAGCWFVPIVSLYMPYQIMKELYLKTRYMIIEKNENYDVKISTTLVGWWWTLWIIFNIFGQIVFRYSYSAKSIDALTTGTILSMIDCQLPLTSTSSLQS